MRPDVIAVGDVMLDVAVDAQELARGGDVHGDVVVRPGGSATNAAVWAATEGARVRLHGRVGEDLAGRLLREAVEERGVETALAVDPEARTGAVMVAREAWERSMVADRGANARLAPEDLPDPVEAGAVLVSGYLLFHPGSEPAARAALERARAEHVAVDAASWPLLRDMGPGTFLEAVAPATMLLANGREAETLGGPDPAAAAERLAERFAIVAVKLGAEGVVVATADGVERIPVEPVEEDDPTGAGDAFDGVLLAALALGASLDEAIRRACAAGALVAASPSSWPEGP
ncbi:MAG: carbohydrate kinase family protein [Actinomycetota bacterium]